MLVKAVSKKMSTGDTYYNEEDDYHHEGQDSESQEATVKIGRDTYNRLKLIVRRKGKDIKNTLNCMAKDYVQKETLFELYKPMLYVVTVKDASLFIKDDKVNKLVEVVLRYRDQKSNDIVIWCNDCKSEYCIHTAFALGSPELGQLNLKYRNNHHTTTTTTRK